MPYCCSPPSAPIGGDNNIMSPETYLKSDHVVGDNLQTSSIWYGRAVAGHVRTNTIGVYHVSLKQQQLQLPKKVHCSSDMFVNRSSKFGHNWKNSSLNQFLFLITMFQLHEVLAETDLLGVTTTNGIMTTNGTTCKERWTCSSCTEATMSICSWIVADQVCMDNTAVAVQSPMVITNGSSCPRFSVKNSVSVLDGKNIMTVMVMVDDRNMGGSFIRLLANSSVLCQPGNHVYTAAEVDGDRISCSWESTRIPQYNTRCQMQLIPHYSHLSIAFDGKLLRFDNVSDHYLTTYPGGGNCPKMECPHCHWSNGTHRFYCSLCSVNNTRFMDITSYCDVRNISSLLYSNTANIRDDKRCSGKSSGVINYSTTPKVILQSDQPPKFDCSQVGNNSSPVPPTLNDGQVFGGIESGGTTLRVHGQHFCWLRDVKCCVKNKRSCSRCDVSNDTLMVCRSPKLNIDRSDVNTIEPFQFYSRNSTGHTAKLNFSSITYNRYQDPVFTDFVVDGCCNVTVNGQYPDQGFAAEDLTIVLVAENSSSPCQITLMDSTQIICMVSQSSSSQLGPFPKQINVTIGDNLNVVKLPKQKYSPLKRSLIRILLPGVITIGAYISFIAVLLVALIFFKASKDYDLLHLHSRQQLAEMRPLDERNPNDYDDNGEPENMLLVRDECH